MKLHVAVPIFVLVKHYSSAREINNLCQCRVSLDFKCTNIDQSFCGKLAGSSLQQDSDSYLNTAAYMLFNDVHYLSDSIPL